MNASRDENFVTTKTLALNTDGKTIIRVTVNPNTHALKVTDGTTGSDHGPKNALRDENDVPTIMGVSSSDFKTPVVVYGDINGAVLIQSS